MVWWLKQRRRISPFDWTYKIPTTTYLYLNDKIISQFNVMYFIVKQKDKQEKDKIGKCVTRKKKKLKTRMLFNQVVKLVDQIKKKIMNNYWLLLLLNS